VVWLHMTEFLVVYRGVTIVACEVVWL
jgi:hypothetical protein